MRWRIDKNACKHQRDAVPDRQVETKQATSGRATAFCDPALAEQILENLLSNANKYAVPETAVFVTPHGDDEHLFCDVYNTANPIPPEDREQLFERNHRGSNSVGVAGTGIGLFMARTLARMQGGDVTLLLDDNGVTFRMTLLRGREPQT